MYTCICDIMSCSLFVGAPIPCGDLVLSSGFVIY